MIIDCHTHLGFDSPVPESVKKLILSLKKAQIDKAMVFAGEINNCSTEKLIEAVKDYQNTLYPIGSISPLSKKLPTPQQVEVWLKENLIYGLKFYPGYEYFYPADLILRPYLKLLIKYNRPAIFHSGDTYNIFPSTKLKYSHPLQIDDLAVDLPELKIIIAHFGSPWVVDTAEVVMKNKNVFADCSGLVYGSFKAADEEFFQRLFTDFKMFGGEEDKLLFGSDWPIGDQRSYLKAAKKIVGNSEKFFSENALKVFAVK